MMEGKRLLAVLAHPDDEVFGLGGTLALYGSKGVEVSLVCATRGEVGEIAAESQATPETLGAVREQELRCSADVLGIDEVIFLDYRDSGMAGTVENEDPRAFMNAQDDEVVLKLVRIMRQIRPDVVITFDPHGGYGHPDHIAAHQHTVTAFHAAGDEGRYPEQGKVWKPARLLYNVLPRSSITQMRVRMEEMGVDISQFDNFEESVRAGWPDEKIHLTVDVSAQTEAKWKAFDCHRTQFSAENPLFRLPKPELESMLRYEHFFCVSPQLLPEERLSDLFGSI
jgi:LmbE family N-acetylglucosaminyl deacetylase